MREQKLSPYLLSFYVIAGTYFAILFQSLVMRKTVLYFYTVMIMIAMTRCQQRQNNNLASNEGGKLFDHYCARCHLGNGIGGPTPIPGLNAPDIRKSTKSAQELEAFISNGFGQMPAFADSTSKENIMLIASYVASQIELHPGKNTASNSPTNP